MDAPRIERLLERLAQGDRDAFEPLFELVYDDLHARAQRMLTPGSAHTLQATALVHEAWMKLGGGQEKSARDRDHFLALASTVMRSVLVDHTRAKHRDKRPDSRARIVLDEAVAVYRDRVPDLLELDEQLKALEALDKRLAKVVELRFFGGLSIAEAAEVLNVGHATVERDWQAARAFLAGRLGHDEGLGAP